MLDNILCGRNRIRLLVLALSSIPIVRSTPSDPPRSLLQWKNCSVENFPSIARLVLPEYTDSLGVAPGLDCAELEVPVDWNKVEGENITLGMARYHATGPGLRLGTVVYNPGGPGGSGAQTVIWQALGIGKYFSNAITGHYDVVGLDPRGVGMSTPVKCDPRLYNARGNTYATQNLEFEKLVSSNKDFGESCRNMTGNLFFHVDTISVAHDVEELRIALDDDRLNWIGLSYGTQIGSTYANLYPQHVGRMVLDGNVDRYQSETSLLYAASAAYEDTLNQFFSWCNTTATAEECPYHNQDFPRLFKNLIAEAVKHPIPAPGCSGNSSSCLPQVSDIDILYNVQPWLSFVNPAPGIPTSWVGLARALNDTLNGNATLLSTAIATSNMDPLFPSLAVGCLDWLHNATSLSDLKYKQQMAINVAPLTKGAGISYLYQTACIGWPADVANPQRTLDGAAMAKLPPILMVNAYHDPATSYVWAEGLRAQIPSAVLLTRNGSGHTSYLLGGATTTAIDAYLVDGVLPGPNTVLNS
ncbi:MAG: hypothetical protein LQ342_007697 [Letrouitia transgressa]|nr:MAG: hypothetical protein LQ342_007697 [Letrouitia transgressa]